VKTQRIACLAGVLLAALPFASNAQQIIQDNFTGASSTFNWVSFLGACLTAGDGTGTIPACVGNPYYNGVTGGGGVSGTLPDPLGQGALRFTDGVPDGYAQAGGIISNFTFPSGQGLEVTFTTITYNGNYGGAGGDGADGISFFLMDGGFQPYDLGAFGGSLGYTCSDRNNDPRLHPDGVPRAYDGIAGGYLGLGIDEFGNFLNQGDNTATGYGYQPGRIGLRGAGSIRWGWLSNNFPLLYPSTLTPAQMASAVKNTCTSGVLWDYSNPAVPAATATPVPDYAPIPNAFEILPVGLQIANEAATTRGQAAPITYSLKITANGLLSFAYSYNGGAYQSVITSQDITAGNGALPPSFRFGFAGSTGGSTNIHEVLCFQAAPAGTASSSAGLNERETAKVQTGTQVYFAFYNPSNWTGSLTAQDLVIDPVTNLVSINPVANWDASCVLTGVAAGQQCIATAAAGPIAAEAPAARQIIAWDGSQGTAFEYPSLSAAEATAIDLGDPVANANRVNYLRGDRTNEVNLQGIGLYRPRTSVLGDIVDSSPTWVGPPSAPYAANWQDLLNAAGPTPENAGQTYPAYTLAAANRLNVVYTGANDGLLHGNRTGSFAGGVYVSNLATPNDGYEVLAYMPGFVVNDIHNAVNASLDFSNPQYGHNYFVDQTPGTGDLFYNGNWHTWLIGGLGAGGQAIYALDVTDPTTFSEANAASLVMGEWNSSTITCVNAPLCGTSLGYTFGVPQIRRFHNGAWGAVFGNGFNSANGDAGIFILLIDPVTGAQNIYYLSTGAAGGNGIAYATPADLDGDHIVDYIYAGDVRGNVWRFDVTNLNPSLWGVTAGGPLFSTPGGQPITTKVMVAAVPSSTGAPRIVVDFGTGAEIPQTNTAPVQYAPGTQSLYGVWDWNMQAWNAVAKVPYAFLPGAPAITVASLQQQTIQEGLAGAAGDATVSSNPVCWAGSTSCANGNVQMGWYINLPGQSEQIIYSPVLEVGAFIVNTTIPATNTPTNCQPSNPAGWTLAISPANGGAFSKSFFGDSGGHFVNYQGQVVSGVALSGTGSVSVVTTGGATPGTFLVTQTSSGVGVVLPINPLASAVGSRLTWIERR
jgi:type IV pilus assembly protein PilY1